ncbi:hypothetical protein EDD75_0369 [Thermodesulfitimonas autotrophica]|uniref:Uncharacterized protein n=1 Tax=Thermodesulfitimonas autotrophica TaxID=1894989 RepID=A0A3N5BPK0_9THEO|nr:hypothetical protein [Thermodesulfitimonas autotrophica]RPF49552.1 hypothetical protein EDD75_0369 [Thermodesulfitimonas autotrophica]
MGVMLVQKEELKFLMRPDVIEETAAEVVRLMAQRNMILYEAQEVLKVVEYRLGLVKLSVSEKSVVGQVFYDLPVK